MAAGLLASSIRRRELLGAWGLKLAEFRGLVTPRGEPAPANKVRGAVNGPGRRIGGPRPAAERLAAQVAYDGVRQPIEAIIERFVVILRA